MFPLSRPMKLAKLKGFDQLRFPCLVTPKLDGIRALNVYGRAVTRSFKPVRNPHAAKLIQSLPHGVDGELVMPDADFSETQSAVMRYEGPPGLVFQLFDWASDKPYAERIKEAESAFAGIPGVEVLSPTPVWSKDELLGVEEDCLAAGYEGIVVRSPEGPYKCGRATALERYGFKHKPVQDSEAIVLAMDEAEENQNPIVANNFGLASRPGGRAGKVPKGTLGGFHVKDLRSGTLFRIGGGKGLTQNLRQQIWDNQAAYIGKIVRYTYQQIGSQGRPRFPQFVGFREPEDMDA